MTSYGDGSSIVRHGVHKELEAEADRWIYDSMKGVTSMEAKKDILTPWKQQDRLNHEVYSAAGVPDESTRRGMYHRAWNREQTHLNSRDGLARGSRFDSLRRFTEEHQADHGSVSDILGSSGFDSAE